MSFRFRKSVRLGKGVRLNFSKRGVGVSVGTKGLRFGVGPSGTRMTAGIPGTGIYYVKRLGSPKRKHRSSVNRRHELIALQREKERMAALEQARYEVELFENQIDVITSVHKECSEPIDWEKMKSSSPPFRIGEPGPNELKALKKLNDYKPTWIDKLFNRAELKKAALQKEVEAAKEIDKKEYEKWKEEVNLAKRIVEGDLTAYTEAIKLLAPFEDIQELGTNLRITTTHPQHVEATVNIHSEKVVPKEVKTLTKTGKVSTRAMSKTRFYELYQDYVCSCVLRIARELFAILPIETVYIHANGEVLNTATGHLEEVTILSVKIPRETLEKLHFDQIDCSDAMSNFDHNMKFRKTKGFAAVEKITPEKGDDRSSFSL